MPNLSPTMTTSPLAILTPLANISKGSPANLSNSTTEPSLSLRRSLIFNSVEPTSTVSLTSIFSKTLRLSIPAPSEEVSSFVCAVSFYAINITPTKL